MRPAVIALTLFVWLGALGGCDTLAPPSGGGAAAPAVPLFSFDSDGDYLLRMARRLRTSSSSELQAEGESLQRAFAARRNEENRVRLAAFLAMAPTPAGDRAKALALLDVPRGDAAGRGRDHPYAAALLPLLLDLRRAEEALSVSQTRLKDEQKRADGLQQSLDALQKSSDAMRLKLEAIRDIEKKLLERPAPK